MNVQSIYNAARAALVGGLLLVAGCADGSISGDVSPDQAVVGTALPAATLQISQGGVYRLDPASPAVPVQNLAARLREHRPGTGSRVLQILAEPGVVGYDVVLATNAAREAGYHQVHGIAEYVPGAANQKTWTQNLDEAKVAPEATDAPLPPR